MKLNGRVLKGTNVVVIPILRGEEAIILKAKAVLSLDEFEKLCPIPVPPVKIHRGGKRVEDVEDKGYKKEVTDHGFRRFYYTILKSLEATEDLIWESVNMSDPSTWGNYEQELKDSDFSNVEIQRIIAGVMEANGLNESKIEEARQRFILSQVEQSDMKLSQPGELQSILSGGPAKD